MKQKTTITAQIEPSLKEKVLYVLQIKQKRTIRDFIETKCKELVKEHEK